MEGLFTLTKLLNKISPDNYFTRNKHFKISSFYHQILSGEISNRENALIKLYPDPQLSSTSFNTLKSRYYSKLLLEIGRLKFNDSLFNPKKKIELEILDYLKIHSILDTGFSSSERSKFLDFILKKCLKIGDVELSLIVIQQCFLNSTWLNNKNKFKYYQDLLLKYKSFYDHKIIALNSYNYLSKLVLERNLNSNENLDTKIVRAVFKIKNSKTTDYNTRFFIYSSIYYYHFLKYDIHDSVIICKKALLYFKNKIKLNKYGYYSFAIKYSYVLMFEKQYQKALKFFDEMLSANISRKQSIWLNINLYAIKNLIYLSRYKEATLRLIDVTRHRDYDKVKTPFFTEIYRIKEAYLNVLYKMKKFVLEDETIWKKKPFRINKFLNEVPIYSKDKRGSNISILIIHVFYLFINKKYDLILNRLESLKAYSHRYLRNDDSLRSNAFIKILQQLPAANYHPVALERHASKYYNKMINAPLHLAARHIEVEVIPYEKQYELLTDLLHLRLNKQI